MDCRERQLDVVFRIFSASTSATLSTVFESGSKDKTPDQIAGLARRRAAWQVAPEAGFDRARGLAAGGRVQGTWSNGRFPFGALSVKALASTESHVVSSSLVGGYESLDVVAAARELAPALRRLVDARRRNGESSPVRAKSCRPVLGNPEADERRRDAIWRRSERRAAAERIRREPGAATDDRRQQLHGVGALRRRDRPSASASVHRVLCADVRVNRRRIPRRLAQTRRRRGS